MKFTSDGAHFYDQDGVPRYDATLTQAKKEGLLISPTTYLGILDKPAITNWKIKEYLVSAHEIMNQFPDTSIDELNQFAKQNFDSRNNAAEKGTAIHWILEEAIKAALPLSAFKKFFLSNADPLIHDLIGSVYLAYEWFVHNCINPTVEGIIVSKKYRYAGKKDVACEALDETGTKYLSTVLDWKSQNIHHNGFYVKEPTKPKKPRVNIYKEWVIQIAAYAAPSADEQGIIGIIGTDPAFPYFQIQRYNQKELLEGFKVFRHLQFLYALLNNIEIN